MIEWKKREYWLLMIAAFMGVVVGALAIAYTHFLEWVAMNSYLRITALQGPERLFIILLPGIGGLLTGVIIKYSGSLAAKGHGMPAILETIETKSKGLTGKDLLTEGIVSLLTIGSGGSAGQIGPITEIGAGIGDIIGRKLSVSLEIYKTLLGCGAAAGITGVFGAPLAGIIFVIEVLFKDLKIRKVGMVLMSALCADVLVKGVAGGYTLFKMPQVNISSPLGFLYSLLLGLLAGLVSFLFIKILYNTTQGFTKISNIPFWTKPAIGGLLLGSIGYFLPQVMGSGGEATANIFEGKTVLWMLLLVLVFKIVGTSLTLGSGGSGGVFSPSLMIGTVLGLIWGKIGQFILPNGGIDAQAYGLVGIAAVIGSVLQAPLTGVIIVFELTGNYSLIIPLLLASVAATMVSKGLNVDNIYSPDLFKRIKIER